MEEENSHKLSPFLSYNWQFSFSPEEWKDLMLSDDENCLPSDLPFVQLAANMIHRDILLIPILQSDIEDDIPDEQKQQNEKNSENERDEKRDGRDKQLLIISHANGNESNPAYPPLTMLYFPEGHFGTQSYFQSIDKISFLLTFFKMKLMPDKPLILQKKMTMIFMMIVMMMMIILTKLIQQGAMHFIKRVY